MISISDKAKEKITDLYIDENDYTIKGLRVFVQGGGCSGFSYGFTFDHQANEDDFHVSLGKFDIMVDAMSMQYLQGATIDYKDELMTKEFIIKNPNAKQTCGCGSSFTV